MVSVIQKPATTIFCVWICSLIVAKLHEQSKILRSHCAAYAWEIGWISLLDSSTADYFSWSLLCSTLQLMHLTVSMSWTIDFSFRSSQLSVIDTGILPITACFLSEVPGTHNSSNVFYCYWTNYPCFACLGSTCLCYLLCWPIYYLKLFFCKSCCNNNDFDNFRDLCNVENGLVNSHN